MKELLGQLSTLEPTRALDVAGGDGRVSKGLLCGRYLAVDFFDQCPEAVKQVRQVKALFPSLSRVEEARMQLYEFKEEYSLIMMCWCSGYLKDEELIAFLTKAQKYLLSGGKRPTRLQLP